MLKPADQPLREPDDDRPIGEIVSQLIDEGKAYARAELELARATAEAKAAAYKWPAILGFTALLVAQSAVTVFAVTIALALASVIGPLAGGLLATLVMAGGAALLGWLAWQKLQAAK